MKKYLHQLIRNRQTTMMKKYLHQLIRNRQTTMMKSPDLVAGLYGYCEKQWHYLSRFEASCNRVAETLFICHVIEHVS